jgi:hypothetical protein
LNVPRPAVVELDANGSPVMIGMRSAKCGMRNSVPQARVPIAAVREVWRIDDEWWRELIARTYYEVVHEGGGRVVLFLDHVTGEWFVQIP